MSALSWATFSPGGGPDEAGQLATYTVSNVSNPGLFSAGPAVNSSGMTAFKSGGWLHVKLALVVLGLLAPHGMMRAKIGKLRRGAKTAALPAWVIPVVLVCAIGAIILGAHPTLLHHS